MPSLSLSAILRCSVLLFNNWAQFFWGMPEERECLWDRRVISSHSRRFALTWMHLLCRVPRVISGPSSHRFFHAHLCFHAARGDVNGGGWSVGQRFHALNVAPDHVSSAHAVCFDLKIAYHVCRIPPTQTTFAFSICKFEDACFQEHTLNFP